MQYIKSFQIFESHDSDNFVVTQDTTIDAFTDYLEEQLDFHSNYGNGMTFESEITEIIENTLKTLGKSEEEIDRLVEEFSKNLDEDTNMIPNTYDEYENSFEGTNSYKNKVVFEWSANGDGYGFGGSLKDLSELLRDIKKLLI